MKKVFTNKIPGSMRQENNLKGEKQFTSKVQEAGAFYA